MRLNPRPDARKALDALRQRFPAAGERRATSSTNVETDFMIHPSDATQRRAARVAGFAYLGNYLTAVLGFVGTAAIVGTGEFAQRAPAIMASEHMYRAALTSMTISWVILSLQAYALYLTLKPVSQHIARFAGILQGSQAIVGAVSIMFGFALLRVYTAVPPAGLLPQGYPEAVLPVLTAAYESGFNVAMLFFAPASLLFFYLFYRSGYLPRPLGAIGLIGSMLMIVATIAGMIQVPGTKAITIAAWVPMGIAEVGTALWLAIKGIRTPSE